MERLRAAVTAVTRHRIFVPALVAAIALTLGLLFAFDYTRNILKVRGPYIIVLAAIAGFPIFAFRFFDPHEDARPIAGYFILVAVYYIFLGSPDFVAFLRMLIFERMQPGAIKQMLLGIAAFAGLSGIVHYTMRIWFPVDSTPQRFLAVSTVKFLVYAILHAVYLNLFIAIAREKFGMLA